MRERPNRMVSKTIVAQATVGSNPTPSAPKAQVGHVAPRGEPGAGHKLVTTTHRRSARPPSRRRQRPSLVSVAIDVLRDCRRRVTETLADDLDRYARLQ